MFRTARYVGLATAASLLFVLIGWLVMNRGPSSVAFAAMVDDMKAAKSVSYAFTERIGQKPQVRGRKFLQGSSERTEVSGVRVTISDRQQKKRLDLDLEANVAYEINLSNAGDVGPIDRFKTMTDQLTDGDASYLGEEDVDGQLCDVYEANERSIPRIKGAPANRRDTIKTWVSRATKLPAKIHWEVTFDDGRRGLVAEFDEFQWNQPLDPSLFDMTPPAGYEVQELRGNDAYFLRAR